MIKTKRVLKLNEENLNEAVDELYRLILKRHMSWKNFENYRNIFITLNIGQYNSIIIMGFKRVPKGMCGGWLCDVNVSDISFVDILSSLSNKLIHNDNIAYIKLEKGEDEITLDIGFNN